MRNTYRRYGNGAGWGETARRTAALVLTAGTLWAVGASAGSEDAAAAFQSIRESVPAAPAAFFREILPDLRIFPDFPDNNGLSPAAAMVLRQSPVLYAAGLEYPGRHPEDAETKHAAENTQADGTPDETETGAAADAESGNAAENAETQSGAADISNGEEADGEGAQNAEEITLPMPETPIQPAESVDNGVRAKTLIPTGTGGYTVIGNVYISSTRKDDLNVSALREPFDAELTGEGPQILILHSHGSEAYTPVSGTEVVWSGDSRTTDFRYGVVKAGDEMASIFADAGISVIHDRTLYDYPDYTGSYDRSLSAIQSYLAQYPTIKFILDVHRDYISDSNGNPYKVVSEIDGLGTAAQMTLVMGSDGSGAAHPDWMENLKLAVAIQEQILTDYPTLMRPILLRKSRYNQHATTGSLLVEVGTAGNAPEEAFLSARLFALEMTKVLIARSK